jgi:hypothetical protein
MDIECMFRTTRPNSCPKALVLLGGVRALSLGDSSLIQDDIEIIQSHPHQPPAEGALGVRGVEDESSIPIELKPIPWEQFKPVVTPLPRLRQVGQDGICNAVLVIVDLSAPDDLRRVIALPQSAPIIVTAVEMYYEEHQPGPRVWPGHDVVHIKLADEAVLGFPCRG